jgi:hypothetical protein
MNHRFLIFLSMCFALLGCVSQSTETTPEEAIETTSIDFSKHCPGLPMEKWQRQARELTYEQVVNSGRELTAELQAEGSLSENANASGGVSGNIKGGSSTSIKGTVKQEVPMSDQEAAADRRYRQTLCPLLAMREDDSLTQEQKNELFTLITALITGYGPEKE